MQGLAMKIMTAPVASSRDTVPVAGIGHLDIPRSSALWRVYGAPRAIIARGDWIDRPSVSIPLTYVSTALLLGDVLEQRTRIAEAEQVRREGVAVAQATRTLDLFTGPAPPVPQPVTSGDAPRGRTVHLTP